MRRWADLLLPLLPLAPIITGLDDPVTRLDVAFGAAFMAFLVWLWLILR